MTKKSCKRNYKRRTVKRSCKKSKRRSVRRSVKRSCKKSKRRSVRRSRNRSRKKSVKRSRKRSCKLDGTKRKRSEEIPDDDIEENILLTEEIPSDIEKYGETLDDKLYDNIGDEFKASDLEFLLQDSDVETIPEEYLEEYKELKPPDKMKLSFSRKDYICPYCEERQYSLDTLIQHVTDDHDKPVYKCNEKNCGYKTVRSTDISKHKNKHKKI